MPEYDVNYKFETIWHGKIEADSFEDAKLLLHEIDVETSVFFDRTEEKLSSIEIGLIMEDGSLWYEPTQNNED